jgi:hypothetical protein
VLQDGTHTPDLTNLSRDIAFTPVFNADAETLAAGEQVQTVVPFTTVTGATEATASLTLTRTVLAVWKNLHVTTVASPLGWYTLTAGNVYPGTTSVRLDEVNTNIQWWAQRTGSMTWPKVYSVVPTAYNAPSTPNDVRIIDVPVSERPPLHPDSWTTDTTVHLLAGHDGVPAKSIAGTTKSDIPQLSRPRHKLKVTASPSGKLGKAASTMNVTFSSTASSYSIQVQHGSEENASNVTWTPANNVLGVQTFSGNGPKPVAYTENPSEGHRYLYVFNAFTQELLADPIYQKGFPQYMYHASNYLNVYRTEPMMDWHCPDGYEGVTTALPAGTTLYGVPWTSFSGNYTLSAALSSDPNKVEISFVSSSVTYSTPGSYAKIVSIISTLTNNVAIGYAAPALCVIDQE